MTAAAESLQLAQPALGAQIKLLEKELGVALLARHSRGISPTQAGVFLFERAKKILADLDDTARQVRDMREGAHEHIVLGVTPSMVMLLGPELLIQARQEVPGLSISLVEERSPVLLEALEAGHIDVAFLYNVENRRNIVRRAIIEEDLLLITAPPGQSGHTAPGDKTAQREKTAQDAASVSLAQALEHELVIAGERGVIRRIVETEAVRLSLKLRLAFEVHSVSSMKALVARGTAASIMPWSLAADELRAGKLLARRIDRPQLTRILYLVQTSGRLNASDNPHMDRFLNHITQRMLELIGPYARSLE